MNSDQIEGNWKQFKGEAQRQWGKLTDDELDRIEGNSTKLAGAIQEKYGKSREEAEKEINEWRRKHKI
ncbi:MAG: CsbD family protein [Gammaproteobacteria bacterium]|nr:CsbD family protein [Gammaproteobacteria bacterium]